MFCLIYTLFWVSDHLKIVMVKVNTLLKLENSFYHGNSQKKKILNPPPNGNLSPNMAMYHLV